MKQHHSQHSFTVYTASAGSGKTFRLTLEYLKIALRNPEYKFRKILAITFTVKATNEMKSRIVEACEAFSSQEVSLLSGRNKALFDALQKETGWTTAEIVSKSTLLHKSILHNYGDFAVSTIDSFSQRLIRSFAYELGIPLQFKVAIEQDDVTDHLTGELYGMIKPENQGFTELMVQFFEKKLNEEDKIRLDYDIQQAIKILLKESSSQIVSNYASLSDNELLKVQQDLDKRVFALQDTIQNIGQDVITLISSHGLGVPDFLYGKSGFMGSFFYAANSDFGKINFGARFHSVIFDKQTWYKKGDEFADHGLIESYILQKGVDLFNTVSRLKLLSLIRKAFPRLALLAQLSKLLKDYKKEEELVLISEFNTILASRIKGEPAPFIFEKVGDYFDHLLLDEFQDTSIIQWHNLVPLVTELLSQEKRPESLLVGDSKQAIYRFRGGETHQLTHLPKLLGSETDELLQEQERVLEEHITKETLVSNYRSRAEIVKFNNGFFKAIKSQPSFAIYQTIYQDHEQKVHQKDSGGYVSIHIMEKDKDQTTDEKLLQRLELFYAQIQKAHSQGFSYSDMAVLARKNDQLQLIAEFLHKRQIPFVSKESLALASKTYISAFPAIIEWLTMPHNQVLQAQIADTFHELGYIDLTKHQMFQEIGQQNFAQISEFTEFLTAHSDKLKLSSLKTQSILHQFETYVSWLPYHLQSSAYISFFRDAMCEQLQEHGNDAEAILDWWREKADKLFIKNSDQEEGMKLLTIHKSKGLEFEVVLMPFVDWNSGQKTSGEWFETDELGQHIQHVYLTNSKSLQDTVYHEEYEEELRKHLLDHINMGYVAFTRAVSELHLITTVHEYEPGSSVSNFGKLLSLILPENQSFVEYGEPVKYEPTEEKETSPPLYLQKENRKANKVSAVVENRAKVIWDENTLEKLAYGNLVHHLLANISTVEEIEKVIHAAIVEGLLQNEDKTTVTQMLHTVVTHPMLVPFFDSSLTTLAERAILMPGISKELVPDRVVFIDENSCQLLDFKTGKKQKKDERQVSEYAEILEQMGFTVEKRILVYINPLEVIQL